MKAEYRCECDDCGTVWISDSWADKCDSCRDSESDDAVPDDSESAYKGFKDEYTGYHGTDWEDIRADVLERDDYECQNCGLSHSEHKQRDDLFGKGLHIHHKTPSKDFDSYVEANDLSNLIALCADCHFAVERGEISL